MGVFAALCIGMVIGAFAAIIAVVIISDWGDKK